MKRLINKEPNVYKINSPDQLGEYIRVSKITVWIILIAITVLLMIVLIWSVVGNLSTIIQVTGKAQDESVVCYLSEEEVTKIAVGMPVKAEDFDGLVVSVSKTPISYKDINDEYTDDYTLYALNVKDWNYKVCVEINGIHDGIHKLKIITGKVRPISFILNNNR